MKRRHLFIAVLVLLFTVSIRSYAFSNEDLIQLSGKEDVVENQEESGEKNGVVADVEISKHNTEEGTFSVALKNIQNASNVKCFDVAVWSDENDQDDVLWFKANKDNNYTINDSIFNHGHSLGQYKIHVYAILNDNTSVWIGEQSLEFNAITSDPVVSEMDSKLRYEVSISDIMLPGGIENVEFAIWSKQNGQDDIKWYEAKEKHGSYHLELNVMNHKGLGDYEVHVYAASWDGVLVKMGQGVFSVETPKIEDISISDIDKVAGVFEINLVNIVNADLISNVQIAVWSEENGQDDIRWYYQEEKNGDEYRQKINIMDHKYTVGKYIIHVYINDLTGGQIFAGYADCNIELNIGDLSVDSSDSSHFTIHLENVSVPGGIKKIEIPVWSEDNGQDDLIWYDATENGNGSYYVNIDFSKHKSLGRYVVHAYILTKGDQYFFVGETSFDIGTPAIKNYNVVEYDVENGTFAINISGISNGEMIQEVLVPVWSEEGGQEDIIWYNAKKSNDDYYVNIDIKDHNYSVGQYNIHVYIRDIFGHEYFVGEMEQNIDIQSGSLSIKKKSDKEYTIELNDVIIPGGENQIQFPVWSEVNGQDDIKWYNASRGSDGVYRYNVKLENHEGLGMYFVHAYVKMKNDKMIFLGNGEFETQVPIIKKISSKVTNYESGEFQVELSGISNCTLIDKILVPIWADPAQKDIVWYTATKSYDDKYVVKVNIANHKYNCAIYNIHVYLRDITGAEYQFNSTTCDMRATYKEISIKDVDGVESIYSISIKELQTPAKIKRVFFAVWGTENGQNDIKWDNAVQTSDHEYESTIRIRDHKELGTYFVHVYYETQEGVEHYLGDAEFSVNVKPSVASINITETDGIKGTFRITLSGVMALSGIEEIKVPVWCAENQSDIVWYDAQKLSESVYTLKVSVAEHAHNFGNYKIHVYITMNNGITALVGSAETKIEPSNYVYSVYLSPTQREVGVMGAYVDRVQFPSWSTANGQDDIVWYEGVNCGNGKWNAVVDSTYHQSGGDYLTHVYLTSGLEQTIAGVLSFSLNWIPNDQQSMILKSNLYSSSTPYLILVNRSTHKVGIFNGSIGKWNLVQYWDCSDGAPNTPTVEGTFHVGIKGYYFDSGSSRCYWYTQFCGNYLFHSVLYNKYNGALADGRLGMALSHGCVRLDINNAKWIYDSIPPGTTVVVYH